MKKIIVTAALLPMLSAWARAANPEGNAVQGQFYLFTGVLASNASESGTNTGFGGEIVIPQSLGVGIDFGYAGEWDFSGHGSSIGVGSLDACYHFSGNKSRRRVEPFLAGGYSLYFGERTTTQSGFNLGGGVNIWAAKHVAVRLEVRYQGGINGFHGYSQFNHFEAFRVGMTFR